METSDVMLTVVSVIVTLVVLFLGSTLIRFRNLFEARFSHQSVIARWIVFVLSVLIAIDPIVALIVILVALYWFARSIGLTR